MRAAFDRLRLSGWSIGNGISANDTIANIDDGGSWHELGARFVWGFALPVRWFALKREIAEQYGRLHSGSV